MERTGLRYADGPTVEVSTVIRASADAVFDLVSDPAVLAELSTELQAAEWVDGSGPAVVGARFRGHNRHAAIGEWTTTSTVIECERPRVFAWAVGGAGEPAATWRFTLDPADGGTRLTQWMRLGPGRSGLTMAIDAMPDKEEKIVVGRLREFEQAMHANLAQISARLAPSGPSG